MPLSNILSCLADQYGHLDTLNIKIHPSLMQLVTVVVLEKHYRQTENREQRNLLLRPLSFIAVPMERHVGQANIWLF